MLMKKLVTLILVLAGIVSTASAASIRHGLIVEVKGDLKDWSGWNYPILHLWYNNGVEDVNVTGDYGSTHLTWLRNTETSQVWYYSFSVDENYKEFSFLLNANGKGEDKWNRVTVNNQDFSCDKYVSLALHNDGSDDVPYVESTTDVPYYFVAADGTKLATLQNTGAVYTGEFTNTAETYAVLAPEYAIQSDNSLNWSLVYRPNNEGGDYLINTFKIYSDGMTADNKTFKFTEEMPYKLSFDLSSSPEFTIAPYITRTINPSVGFATFSFTDDVAIPDGVTAWFAKEVDAQGRLIMKKYLKCIPWEEGALLQGSGEITFTPAETEDDWASEPIWIGDPNNFNSLNLLKGSYDAEVPLYPHGKYLPDNYHYILAGTSASDVGFYYVDQQRNSAIGKAYLETSVPLIGTDAGARAAWVFDEEGETTGINEVKATKVAEGFFNLAGQRVAQPTKGLYIVNGKKVIMK